MGDPDADPADFELVKYQLDRAHELELNKFAHALELERLKVIQIVNGGAFTVLVAVAPHLFRGHGYSPWFALAAASAWVLGLGAAAWATQVQLLAQSRVNQAYRYRRNAVEWRRLRKMLGDETLVAPRIGAPKHKTADLSDKSYDFWAQEAWQTGQDEGRTVFHLIMASIGFFLLGGALLTASLAVADPAQFAAT